MWTKWKKWPKCANYHLPHLNRLELAGRRRGPDPTSSRRQEQKTLTEARTLPISPMSKISLSNLKKTATIFKNLILHHSQICSKYRRSRHNRSIWCTMRWVRYQECVIRRSSAKCSTKCSCQPCKLTDKRKRKGRSEDPLRTQGPLKPAQVRANGRPPGQDTRPNKD